jgi:alanine racemase
VTDSRLSVDLDALAHNYALLRAQAGGAEVAAVVKADGYGLGAAPIARRLHAEGARTFFVARLSEGEALRKALGPDRAADLYVLDGAAPGSGARLREARLIPVLNSEAQLDLWGAEGRAGGPLPAAIHVDTGMNRLGLRPEGAAALARDHGRLQGLRIVHILSHLACAENEGAAANKRQLAAFRQARALFPDARASLANSAGVFLGPDYAFDMVRPGISLYGGGPRGHPDPRLKAVATFEAPVLQLRDVPPGETVGYGGTFRAERPMRVAIIAAGYADGVLRAGSPGGYGVLTGRRLPFLGRVSMDLIALDATEALVGEGELIQLLGPEAPVDEAAAVAGTIAYELLTRISARAERRYLGAGA